MKSHIFSHPLTLCLATLLLLTGLPVLAQDEEVIGRILIVSGTVEAESPDKLPESVNEPVSLGFNCLLSNTAMLLLSS